MLKGETDEDGGKGGRALAVQDVNAPAEYVWDRILDFGSYNKMVRYDGFCLCFFTVAVCVCVFVTSRFTVAVLVKYLLRSASVVVVFCCSFSLMVRLPSRASV